jgi:ATP-binding cassette subfamily G (WHITE) protein 2 (SNQ2)
MMTGRPILYKQLSYRFYRASALSVAQTITDIPLTSIRIMLFSIIIYFMCGLQRSAGAFFTFYLFMYGAFLFILYWENSRLGLQLCDVPGNGRFLPIGK